MGTEASTEAPSTEASTEAPSEEASTEAPSEEASTEAPSEEAPTEAPTTTTVLVIPDHCEKILSGATSSTASVVALLLPIFYYHFLFLLKWLGEMITSIDIEISCWFFILLAIDIF